MPRIPTQARSREGEKSLVGITDAGSELLPTLYCPTDRGELHVSYSEVKSLLY